MHSVPVILRGRYYALPSGETVSDALRNKHANAEGLSEEALVCSDNFPPLPDQVIFECIDADLIRHAVKQTNGSAGPSGLNALAWRRVLFFQGGFRCFMPFSCSSFSSFMY